MLSTLISSAYRFFYYFYYYHFGAAEAIHFPASSRRDRDPDSGRLWRHAKTIWDFTPTLISVSSLTVAAMCLILSDPIFHDQKDNLLTKLPLVSFQNCQQCRQVASKEKSTIFSFFSPVSPSMTTNQIKPIQSRRMCFYVGAKKIEYWIK